MPVKTTYRTKIWCDICGECVAVSHECDTEARADEVASNRAPGRGCKVVGGQWLCSDKCADEWRAKYKIKALDFTKPMKLNRSGRGAKWISQDVVEICGSQDCKCGGNPKSPCGARQCVYQETGIIYSSLYRGEVVVNVAEAQQVEAQAAEVAA